MIKQDSELMPNEEEKAAPPADTNQAVPPEEQIPLKKMRRSISLGLICLVLLLFVPGWYGILYILSEYWHTSFPGMYVTFMLVVTFSICAFIAIERLIHVKTKNDFTKAAIVILLLIDAFMIVNFSLLFVSLQYKSDMIYATGHLRQIFERINAYQAEHGSYPPQQDMRSLLKTLGITKRDLSYSGKQRIFKVITIDIPSAEYHVPAKESGHPYFVMRFSRGPFKEKKTYVVRDFDAEYLAIEAEKKAGTARCDTGESIDMSQQFVHGGIFFQPLVESDGKEKPERKPEADRSIIIQEETK